MLVKDEVFDATVALDGTLRVCKLFGPRGTRCSRLARQMAREKVVERCGHVRQVPHGSPVLPHACGACQPAVVRWCLEDGIPADLVVVLDVASIVPLFARLREEFRFVPPVQRYQRLPREDAQKVECSWNQHDEVMVLPSKVQHNEIAQETSNQQDGRHYVADGK